MDHVIILIKQYCVHYLAIPESSVRSFLSILFFKIYQDGVSQSTIAAVQNELKNVVSPNEVVTTSKATSAAAVGKVSFSSLLTSIRHNQSHQ